MLFGLFMALTFVGAVSAATSGREELRTMFIAALGCISADLFSAAEIEALRARIAALPPVAVRPRLERDDLLAGLGIFLIVVVSTLPVVLPFLVIADVGTAKYVSRAVALTMLFFGGLVLGHYAGYGSWKAGLTMVGLGTGLVIVINALGG